MKNYLGIEFGSTRIKAIVINETFEVVSSGSFTWKSDFIDGVWTYSLDEAVRGLKTALNEALAGRNIEIFSCGISGMMHGHLAFDKDWNLLAPFRTWQNTITAEASEALTREFGFNVPQRWSIAHLYQAILNGENHVGSIAHITTLAGYIHHLLTGENVLGIGEASGVFPIDSETENYNEVMLTKFDALIEKYGFSWKVRDVLPSVMTAGEIAGFLSPDGENLSQGLLPSRLKFAPPEGDMCTGMVATDSVGERTGNVSAGTSINYVVVLEKPLSKMYPEIDVFTTPTGKPAAMVHCNNCTNSVNQWVKLLLEAVEMFGERPDADKLYSTLYRESLKGEKDCGGVVSVNYLAGESITHFDEGRPFVVSKPDTNLTLANFIKSQLYSTFVTLKIGMKILESESVKVDSVIGHGGLFKVQGVCQKYLCAALNTSVTVNETAGEGGPFGMAVLAAFLDYKHMPLDSFLHSKVFTNVKSVTESPTREDVESFEDYTDRFIKCLNAEKELLKHFN